MSELFEKIGEAIVPTIAVCFFTFAGLLAFAPVGVKIDRWIDENFDPESYAYQLREYREEQARELEEDRVKRAEIAKNWVGPTATDLALQSKYLECVRLEWEGVLDRSSPRHNRKRVLEFGDIPTASELAELRWEETLRNWAQRRLCESIEAKRAAIKANRR